MFEDNIEPTKQGTILTESLPLLRALAVNLGNILKISYIIQIFMFYTIDHTQSHNRHIVVHPVLQLAGIRPRVFVHEPSFA